MGANQTKCEVRGVRPNEESGKSRQESRTVWGVLGQRGLMEKIVLSGRCDVIEHLRLGEKPMRSSPSPICVTSVGDNPVYQRDEP